MNRFSTFRNINLAAFGFVVFAGACSLDKWGTQPGGPLGVGGSGGSGSDAVTVSNTSSTTSGPGGSGGSGGSGGGQACSGTLVLCDGTCVDTQNDIANCGGCMVACTAMQPVCENGACKACKQGDTLPCYSGPPGTEGVGACKPGLSTCKQDGSGFGACMGDVVPSTEICGNTVDENCDNVIAVGSSCLVSQDLVVRYFLDEAASGQTPAAALDSAPNPRDLVIAYTTAQPTYTAAGTGRGLTWAQNDQGGVATTTMDNTKILSMLEGKTQGTIEFVTQIDNANGNLDRVVSIGTNTDNRFSIGTDNVNGGVGFTFEVNSNVRGEWNINISSRAVYHLVMNTADGNASNRVRLFMNGTLQTNTNTSSPQNEALNIGAGRSFSLGNRENGGRSIKGVLYYAAVYSRALTDAEITNNVGILSANDDQ